MAIDRAKAFEVSENGLLLEGGAHFSSGTDAPTHSGLAGDWYFRITDATLWKLALTGNAWSRLSGPDIPFNNVGVKFNSSNVEDAIKEMQANDVHDTDNLVSSTNGFHQILPVDSDIHFISGTATGYEILLPDALSLFNGRRFEVVNASSQAVLVKDFIGTVLVTLISGDSAIFTLRSNSSSAGDWTATVNTSVASGVNAFNVVGSVLFQVGSAADTLITGLSITPPSGTYGIWFSSDINIQSNNRIARCVIYRAGLEVADSRRNQQGVGSNYKGSLSTITIAQVNGSQALDVRANVSSGTLDILGRSFLLIRLGA